MEIINSYALRELEESDVFVFSVILCDNEIDRDGERFTVDSLRSLEKLFVGKTAIMNHSMKTEDQSARTFKTQLISDGRKNSLGEDYFYLKAWAYMIRTDSNADLIKEIEAGIKKETSVSCSVEDVRCSVCGKSRRKSRCEHLKGEKYGDSLCFDELINPTDAYEWSFVAVPAQKNAGVTKTFEKKEERTTQDILKSIENGESVTLDRGQSEKLSAFIDELKEKAKDGEEYRSFLLKKAVSLAALTLPEMNAQQVGEICRSISLKNLKLFTEALEKNTQKNLPVGYQTQTSADDTKGESNSPFVI